MRKSATSLITHIQNINEDQWLDYYIFGVIIKIPARGLVRRENIPRCGGSARSEK